MPHGSTAPIGQEHRRKRKTPCLAAKKKAKKRVPFTERQRSYQLLQEKHAEVNKAILKNLTEKHEREMKVQDDISKMCQAVVALCSKLVDYID